MLSWDLEPDPPEIIGTWFLWKLIVDRGHQRRGIDAKVVRMIADIGRVDGRMSC